jgi:hypothetical protein
MTHQTPCITANTFAWTPQPDGRMFGTQVSSAGTISVIFNPTDRKIFPVGVYEKDGHRWIVRTLPNAYYNSEQPLVNFLTYILTHATQLQLSDVSFCAFYRNTLYYNGTNQTHCVSMFDQYPHLTMHLFELSYSSTK